MAMPGPSDHIKDILSIMLEKALVQLNIRTFNEYIKTVGLADGMAVMRLYKKRNGYILLSLIKNKVGTKGTGLDAIILPMALGQVALNSDPKNVEGAITEGGGVVKVHDCIFKGATPEFCVTISHYTADLICEAINPDYECIWTHHLNEGDPYCRYIYKKKGDRVDLENPGRIITPLSFPPMPESDLRDIRNFILSHFWDSTTEAFMDLQGSWVTMDHLLPIAYQIGEEMGHELRELGTTQGLTVAMAGSMLDTLGDIIHQIGTPTRASSDEFVKAVVDCPFRTFPREICRQIESLYQGLIHAIRPDLEFSYMEMMNEGGRQCAWSLRRKGISPSQSNLIGQNAPLTQDPMIQLKMRLAKGEIDLDEYHAIRKAISEP